MSDTTIASKSVELSVLRYRPASDREPVFVSYRVAYSDDMSVLQASLGSPLIIMPQLPQTAIRHDQRNERLPSCVSLMDCKACSTDMSSE